MTLPTTETYRVPAHVESTRQLAIRAEQAALQAGLDEQAAFRCRLAMDEACTNITEHAYPGDEKGEIAVEFHIKRGEVTFSLTDFGEPYDPAQVKSQPLNGARVEDAKPGGLGLYLMRRVMDEIRYTSHAQGNTLVMVKRR